MSKVQIVIPGETARRSIHHPWASTFLPPFDGLWYQNKETGEDEFRAEVEESKLAEFTERLQILEGAR